MSRVVNASPGDFFPPPKVASRVLQFERLAGVELGPRFLTFVKAAFAFRRKFLIKNLKAVVEPARLEPAFATCRLSPQARAEELSPAQFVQLFRTLSE
jgi:16S rRNA (adenine1518-N6/adenine1519-N6)-dimethyltransferase